MSHHAALSTIFHRQQIISIIMFKWLEHQMNSKDCSCLLTVFRYLSFKPHTYYLPPPPLSLSVSLIRPQYRSARILIFMSTFIHFFSLYIAAICALFDTYRRQFLDCMQCTASMSSVSAISLCMLSTNYKLKWDTAQMKKSKKWYDKKAASKEKKKSHQNEGERQKIWSSNEMV